MGEEARDLTSPLAFIDDAAEVFYERFVSGGITAGEL